MDFAFVTKGSSKKRRPETTSNEIRYIATMIDEVLSCTNREQFLLLGEMYYSHFVRAFRSNKVRIPTPSSHASRPSFDRLADMVKAAMEETPSSHGSAKRKALVRDGFRCVVTGRYDHATYRQSEEIRVEADAKNASIMPTECAHILDESTNFNIKSKPDKEEYASTVWTIMKRFGYESLPEELNGPLIHRLENVMTLSQDIHYMFDHLELWFAEMPKLHCYKLEAVEIFQRVLSTLPEYVTFTTPDKDKLPLPSPSYLKLHAACCRIAHLSGAAEYVEKFYRDMEDTQVLAHDGSAAKLLEEALLHASSRASSSSRPTLSVESGYTNSLPEGSVQRVTDFAIVKVLEKVEPRPIRNPIKPKTYMRRVSMSN